MPHPCLDPVRKGVGSRTTSRHDHPCGQLPQESGHCGVAYSPPMGTFAPNPPATGTFRPCENYHGEVGRYVSNLSVRWFEQGNWPCAPGDVRR